MTDTLYEELDVSKKEFRLIEILPVARNSEILAVRLSKHSLEKVPRYLGLSYACGDQKSRADIKVNGVVLSVTTNLHEALQSLQPNSIGFLWVDAICIHQFDNDEKSAQVILMGQIYERAHAVIAWLGPWSAECAAGIDLIRTWTTYPEEDILNNWGSFLEMFPDAFSKTTWDGFRALFDRPYWSRMWTYQEFAAARTITFLCGDEEFTITKFSDAIFLWSKVLNSATSLGLTPDMIRCFDLAQLGNFKEIENHRLLHHSDEKFRREWLTPRFGLSGIMDSEHHRFSSDPRDKIFAAVSVDEIGDIKIVPDYSKTTVEVYTEYAIQYTKTQSLAVLLQSGVGIDFVEADDKPDLPSWVPDHRPHARWPMDMREKGFKAYGGLKPSFFTVRPGTLYAKGVTVDIVTTSLPKTSRFNDDWNDFIRDYDVPHPTGVPQIQAYIRAISLDSSDSTAHSGVIPPSERQKTYFDHVLGFMYGAGMSTLHGLLQQPWGKELHTWLQALTANNADYAQWFTIWQSASRKWQAPRPGTSDQHLLEAFTGSPRSPTYKPFPCADYAKENAFVALANRCRDYTNQVTLCRRLFTTRKGYVGIGPELMQEGDVLTVLCGSDVPILLRRVHGDGDNDGDEDDHHFVNVGQCYVYGLMYGEITHDGPVELERFCIR